MLQKRPPPGERCDFCSTPLAPEHSHLIELAARRILCACRPCYIVFEPEGAAQGKYRAVPTRYREIDGVRDRRREVGCAASPDRSRVFLLQLARKARWSRSTRARPARPSRCSRSTRGTRSPRGIPSSASIKPDVEAILMQRNRESIARLHRADRLGVRAGRSDPNVVERLRRRPRSARKDRGVLRKSAGAQPGKVTARVS